MNYPKILITTLLLTTTLLAATPNIRITHPPRGSTLNHSHQAFVIGSISPPDATLTINNNPVIPHTTGGFLYMAPLTNGTNILELKSGDTTLTHTFIVRHPPAQWDGKSLEIKEPLEPLGIYTNEAIQLSCLAPPDTTITVKAGTQTQQLAPSPDSPTLYQGTITLADPITNTPIIFSTPDNTTTATTITVQHEWHPLQVTGRLFETRAFATINGETKAAFLTPGLTLRGAGFRGKQQRLWLDNHIYRVASHLVSPATNNTPSPPADQPAPNLAAGFPTHPPTNLPPSEITIILDPGHGATSSGAIGPTGLQEKTANLEQTLIVRDKLQQAGFKVIMTRTDDSDPDLYTRALLAYNTRAAAFISIHYNSCGYASNPTETRHIATYYWNEPGRNLATALHQPLAAITPIRDAGVRFASFAVCRNPAIPSCLLELDFITCPIGEDQLRQPQRQQQVADAILQGLRNWLSP